MQTPIVATMAGLAVGLLVGVSAVSSQARGGAKEGVPLVGMMYEAWHAPAWTGLKDPTTAITLEEVIRSNGSITLADMQSGIDLATAMNFHYHKQPKEGFYCIYRKRSNETTGDLPRDCPNITATLTRHASMLVRADRGRPNLS